MTRIKTVLLLIVLLVILASQAQAVEQVYHWTPPTTGSEVHHYQVCITMDGGECITLSVEPTETTITLDFDENTVYTVAVTAIDANNHPSIQSKYSNPYAYTMPGQPGQPWRE